MKRMGVLFLLLVSCSQPRFEFQAGDPASLSDKGDDGNDRSADPGSPSGTNPVNGSPPSGPRHDSLETSGSRPRLTSRIYLASALTEMFPDKKFFAEGILYPAINNNPEFNCDPYSLSCTIPAHSQLAVAPSSVPPTQMALMLNTCRMTIHYNWYFAADRLTGHPETGRTEFPDEEEVKKAFELYHPGIEAPDDVVDALVEISREVKQTNKPASTAWYLILETLCESPSWQTP